MKANSQFKHALNAFFEESVSVLYKYRSVIVFFANLLTVILSLFLASFLRFEFSLPSEDMLSFSNVLILAIIIKIAVFAAFKLNSGMWRYVSINDLMKILFANLIATSVIFLIVNFFHEQYFIGFSRSILIIDFLLCFLFMSGKRVSARILREAASKSFGQSEIRTIALGRPDTISNLIMAFESSKSSKQKIVGILCEKIRIGDTIRGVKVLGEPHSAAKVAKKHNVSELLLMPPYSTPKQIRKILDELEERNARCKLRMIPEYIDLAKGEINASNIKEVEIEDLLGRKPVSLDRTEVKNFLKNKNILVTGAGGSIGSELCHQICSYEPAKIVLFELSELNLYNVSRMLKKQFPNIELLSVLGDIREKNDLKYSFEKHKINIVYHAAAYKHVNLVQENAVTAFKTNLTGTANLAEICELCGIKRVVIISTDKAVCPTSIMGATKRLAERAVLERPKNGTEYIVVRFGNVLGSSGSVIPLFKQQIREGGPLTLTSKKVVRYFMSIPEAVDLVLQSATIGNDREIMVLEMGEPIRIYDMAKKLIKLSGLVPEKDIDIELIGLRPGEKEYEELLTKEEEVKRTPFDKIFVARKDSRNLPSLDIGLIKKHIKENNIEALKIIMKEHIPENKFNEKS